MKLSKLFTVCGLTASLLTLSAKDNSPIPTKFSQEYEVLGHSKGITEGGFYLNFVAMIPIKKYSSLVSPPTTVFSEKNYNTGGGLEIGNYFRAVDLDNIAIGVKATWLSVAFASTNVSGSNNHSLLAGALHVGPYLGYALNKEMATEVYYQAAPSTNILFDDDIYFGIAHKIGLTYRYKIFALGLEYQTGKVNYLDSSLDSEETTDFNGNTITDNNTEYNLFINNVRINLGFKF